MERGSAKSSIPHGAQSAHKGLNRDEQKLAPAFAYGQLKQFRLGGVRFANTCFDECAHRAGRPRARATVHWRVPVACLMSAQSDSRPSEYEFRARLRRPAAAEDEPGTGGGRAAPSTAVSRLPAYHPRPRDERPPAIHTRGRLPRPRSRYVRYPRSRSHARCRRHRPGS